MPFQKYLCKKEKRPPHALQASLLYTVQYTGTGVYDVYKAKWQCIKDKMVFYTDCKITHIDRICEQIY